MADNSDFVRSIKDATLQIIADTTKNMKRACLVVEGSAKEKCPVDTGILAGSITSEVETTAESITGRIGTNLLYGLYVHQGTGIWAKDGNGRKTPWLWFGHGKYAGGHMTVGQHPQPFLEDARTENKDRIARILGGK